MMPRPSIWYLPKGTYWSVYRKTTRSGSANQRERDVGMVMADDTHIEISVDGQVSLTPVIRLWPDGPPSGLPGVGSEITFPSPAIFGPETDMLRNVSDASLTVFMPGPAKANGVGVIVCPGGGWRGLGFENDGPPPARWLAPRRYTAFPRKYWGLGQRG